MNKIIGFAITCLLLASCASKKDTDTPPEWVYGKSSQYKQNQYITGYGTAAHASLAKDRARADLAKVFNVSINEKINDDSSAEFNWAQSGSAVERSNIRRELSASTQQTLSSVTVPEIWMNPKDQQFHALAVLSRAQMMNQLQMKIDGLDAATRQSIRLSNKTQTRLGKIKMASKAVKLQKERSLLQSQLQVVDLSGLGVTPKWTVEQLQSHRLELVSDIRLGTRTTGQFSHEIRSAVDSILTRRGFTLSNLGQLKLNTHMNAKSLGEKNGWHWMTGHLQITLIENGTLTVGEKSWHLKVSASDPDLARTRLIQKAESTLNNELEKTLFHFFE